MHADWVGLGVVDDPLDAAGPCPRLLRREDPAELLEVQVPQIEAAPILGRGVRRRGAVPTRHWDAALRRHRDGHDVGSDLIVLRPGHPRLRGALWIAAKIASVRVCV